MLARRKDRGSTDKWIVSMGELMLCAYTVKQNQKESINLLMEFNGQMLKAAKDPKGAGLSGKNGRHKMQREKAKTSAINYPSFSSFITH